MKILCVGRNYIDHAKELNNPVPNEPVIFIKPSTALTRIQKPFYYPEFTNDLHYEAELVLRIKKHGKHIEEQFAYDYFDEFTIGIDLTARDLQNKCKEKGLPWEIAKGFDGSAVIGDLIPFSSAKEPISFSLQKNKETMQQGNSGEMIFSFAQIISYISKFFTLQKGDLIFTGTPAGVGKLAIGDELEGFVEGKRLLYCQIK